MHIAALILSALICSAFINYLREREEKKKTASTSTDACSPGSNAMTTPNSAQFSNLLAMFSQVCRNNSSIDRRLTKEIGLLSYEDVECVIKEAHSYFTKSELGLLWPLNTSHAQVAYQTAIELGNADIFRSMAQFNTKCHDSVSSSYIFLSAIADFKHVLGGNTSDSMTRYALYHSVSRASDRFQKIYGRALQGYPREKPGVLAALLGS